MAERLESAQCCKSHYLNCTLSYDFTAIPFKQVELCFHILFWYQMSSECGETAMVSCKNCHNFITKRFQKKLVFYFDPCIILSLLVAQSTDTQTDRNSDYSNPPLCLCRIGLIIGCCVSGMRNSVMITECWTLQKIIGILFSPYRPCAVDIRRLNLPDIFQIMSSKKMFLYILQKKTTYNHVQTICCSIPIGNYQTVEIH